MSIASTVAANHHQVSHSIRCACRWVIPQGADGEPSAAALAAHIAEETLRELAARGEDAAEHAPAPKTPAEIVAETHWTSHHGGFHCVGCGWDDIGPTEDYAAATRRHVAEETYKATVAQLATPSTADVAA